MTGVEELCSIAIAAAKEAGQHVLARSRDGVKVEATKTSISDVVTAVDLEAEEIIHRLIAKARPNDGFFGEEGRFSESATGITWIVDPIDGTVNFLYGIPYYAVSIAAVLGAPDPSQWEVLAGAVYNPAAGEMYFASLGTGAYLGKKKLEVARPVALGNALLLTGFAYSETIRRAQGQLMGLILPSVRDIRRLGTASLDLAAIADGRANIYFERTLSPWDHAAGELLVTEAGGKVCGFGEEASSREALFAGHPEMVKKVQQLVSANGGNVALADID